MKMNSIVVSVVIRVKVVIRLGIRQISSVLFSRYRYENSRLWVGIVVCDSFDSLCGVWFFLVRLYSMWLVEKMLLLVEDVVEVSIMKLIRLVVVGMLVSMNSCMNGFLFGIIWCYGVMVMIVISVSMQKMMMCIGIELIVLGRLCLGLVVLVVVVLISLMLMKVNIVIWNLVKKLIRFIGNMLLLFYRFDNDVVWLFGEVKFYVIRLVLVMISVQIVMILISVNQNFILLNSFIVIRFNVSSSIMQVSVGFQVLSFGNQNCVQVVIVIMLVMVVMIQQNQQVYLQKNLVYGLSRLVEKLMKDLYCRLDSSSLFIVCIMKNSIVLMIRQMKMMDGLVRLMVLFEFMNRLVLMVLLMVISCRWWLDRLWCRCLGGVVGLVMGVGRGG